MSAEDLPRSIQFALEPEDFARANAEALQSMPELSRALRRERLESVVLGISFGLLMGGMFAVLAWSSELDFTSLRNLAIVISVLMCVLGIVAAQGRGPVGSLVHRIQSGADASRVANPPHVVRLMEDGIETSAENSTTVFHWKMLNEPVLLSRWLFVPFADGFGGLPIPRSAFEDDIALDTWRRAILSRLTNAGCDNATRVRQITANAAHQCLFCKHALSGLRDPVCPECGVSLTPLRLHLWKFIARARWGIRLRAGAGWRVRFKG